MERPDPFPASNSFIGPTAPHDCVARPLACSEKSAVDAGAPPGLASRPLVVSPPSTTGAVTASSDLMLEPVIAQPRPLEPLKPQLTMVRPPFTSNRAYKIFIFPPPRADGQGLAQAVANCNVPGHPPPTTCAGRNAGTLRFKLDRNSIPFMEPSTTRAPRHGARPRGRRRPTTITQDRLPHRLQQGQHRRLRFTIRNLSSSPTTPPTLFPASSTTLTNTGYVNNARSSTVPPPSASY